MCNARGAGHIHSGAHARPGFYHETREELERSGAVVHEELRPRTGAWLLAFVHLVCRTYVEAPGQPSEAGCG